MPDAAPRFLYLHGFASGPASSKGVALARYYAAKGTSIERLDLRVPSFEHLRLSAGIARVIEAIGGPRERVVVFGSSLGGLTACRAAERDPRIAALVLLAPAFRIAERWRARMGDEQWSAWRERGWLEVDDYARGGRSRVDFAFVEEAAAIDDEGGPFPDVRVPCLIIHGRGDATVDIGLSREFAAGRRHVRLVEVDDGHELRASLPVIERASDAFLAPFLGSAAAPA